MKEAQETMHRIKKSKYVLFHCLLISQHSFYSNLPSATKDNQELKKETLRRQYHNEDWQRLLRSEMCALTQTGNLTQYIDQLETLCQQLDIKIETKIYKLIHSLLAYPNLFKLIHSLKPHLELQEQ